jgi:hypothetical protein
MKGANITLKRLTSSSALDDPHYVAFYGLGTGSCRAAPKSTRGLHSLVGCSQQVFEMD